MRIILTLLVCTATGWPVVTLPGSIGTPGVQVASSTESVDNEAHDTTRMQWYHSKTQVHIYIHAKNVDKANSTVVFGERILSMWLSRREKKNYLLDAYLAEAIYPSTGMVALSDSRWRLAFSRSPTTSPGAR